MRYFYKHDGKTIFVPMEGNGISLLGHTNLPQDETISAGEQVILRSLAGKVAELANLPSEQKKKDHWKQLNSLESDRPVVFCDPENAWGEIITPKELLCQHELARNWEFTLRREIFWAEKIQDDRVINPYFSIPYFYSQSDWGVHEERIGGSEDGKTYAWKPALQDWNQMQFIHPPKINIDEETTKRILEKADAIFGDLLPVKLDMVWLWTQGLTQELGLLRGMEQMMLDMVDYPDELHKLMQKLQLAMLQRMDSLEENGRLFLNNNGTYIGSGGFGWTSELPQPDFKGKVRTRDLWGFCESQETVGISPKMFAEFILPYQLLIMERFGLVCYGCCEPLEKRWKYIKDIPRLRRVSVSPFANWQLMADCLTDQFIFSMKVNPMPLSFSVFDEESIRSELRSALKKTRDCHVEIILKDTHTIRNDPNRVITWTKVARQEAENL